MLRIISNFLVSFNMTYFHLDQDGMKPNEEIHGTYLSVEPVTGLIIGKTLKLNLKLISIKNSVISTKMSIS